MIDLSRAALHAEGVTIFPDHANPAQFHYLPDAPRLSVRSDGMPELSLLKYQLDLSLNQSLDAGMLALTVDLGVDDDAIEKLKGRLRAQFSLDKEPVVSPVVADSGTCEIMVINSEFQSGRHDASDIDWRACACSADLGKRRLIPRRPQCCDIYDAARCSGREPGRAGAAGWRPSGRNCICARGLGASSRHAGADHRALAGHLSLLRGPPSWRETAVRYGYRDHDLGPRTFGGPLITIDDFLPPDQKDQTFQQAVDWMQNYVVEQFFKPTLGAAPPPAGDSSDGPLATIGNAIKDVAGFFSVTYTLKQIDRNELKTLSYQLNAASARAADFGAAGHILGPAVAKGRNASDRSGQVDHDSENRHLATDGFRYCACAQLGC